MSHWGLGTDRWWFNRGHFPIQKMPWLQPKRGWPIVWEILSYATTLDPYRDIRIVSPWLHWAVSQMPHNGMDPSGTSYTPTCGTWRVPLLLLLQKIQSQRLLGQVALLWDWTWWNRMSNPIQLLLKWYICRGKWARPRLPATVCVLQG